MSSISLCYYKTHFQKILINFPMPDLLAIVVVVTAHAGDGG